MEKVVHLVEDMGVGGLERNIALIVENLDRSRFDVSVWCLEEGGDIADELMGKGIDVRILGLSNYHNPLNIMKLARQLTANRTDILHTHGYFANTMGRLTAIFAGTQKRFAHIQNSHWTAEERKKRHYLIDRILSRFCNRIIACSETARQFQIEIGKINPNKIVTVHNCTDVELYDPFKKRRGIRDEFGFTDKNILLATVGRLTKVKGHPFLIKAASKLIKDYPEARILIVGDGIERENLQNLVQEYSLQDYVHFLGTRQDIPNILSSIDIFIQPTLTREGLPLSITEAMACGKPVVATDVGGVSEAITDRITGMLVPPGKEDALRDAILYLLNSPEKCRQIATTGRNLCLEKFSSENMIRKIEYIYDKNPESIDLDSFSINKRTHIFLSS